MVSPIAGVSRQMEQASEQSFCKKYSTPFSTQESRLFTIQQCTGVIRHSLVPQTLEGCQSEQRMHQDVDDCSHQEPIAFHNHFCIDIGQPEKCRRFSNAQHHKSICISIFNTQLSWHVYSIKFYSS